MISAILKAYWKQIAGAVGAIVVVVSIIVAWNAHGTGRYEAGKAVAHQEWELKWSERDKTDVQAKSKKEAEEREEETRRQTAANKEQVNGEKTLAKARADADNAQRSADGLHRQLSELQRQLRRSETGRISAVAELSQARGEAVVLLAQLLSESDKAAGEYAAAADRAYESGLTCEKVYNSVAFGNGVFHGTHY